MRPLEAINKAGLVGVHPYAPTSLVKILQGFETAWAVRPLKSARGSVLLFVEPGTWNVKP